MNSVRDSGDARYDAMDRAPHSLHECGTADEFGRRFARITQSSVEQVVGRVVTPTAPKAVFLVGSLTLGMATPGSDVDLIVLVDGSAAVLDQETHLTNTNHRLEFSNVSDPLRVKEFLAVINGLVVDITVVITSGIKEIYSRLRSKGPELSETDILILGRLSRGWLLLETPGYLQRSGLSLTDRALDVYCCTKHFVSALHNIKKGRKVVELGDVPLALHLGRRAVEDCYLAYFSSEGFSYLGEKWLAQIGHASGAAERLRRHPLLKTGVPLMFPGLEGLQEAGRYLEAVREFIGSMRQLIEQKTLFRIAFEACPQVVAA